MSTSAMKPQALLLWVAAFAASARAYTVSPPTTAPNNTIQDCTNWDIATSSDTCETLATDNSITLAQLYDYVSEPHPPCFRY